MAASHIHDQEDPDVTGNSAELGEPLWLLEKSESDFLFTSFLLSLLVHGAFIAVMAATHVLPPFSGMPGGPISVLLAPAVPEQATSSREHGGDGKADTPSDTAATRKARHGGTSPGKRSAVRPGVNPFPDVRLPAAAAEKSGRIKHQPGIHGETGTEMVISRYEGKVVEVLDRKAAPPVFRRVSSAMGAQSARAVVYEMPETGNEETDPSAEQDNDTASFPEMVFEEDEDHAGKGTRTSAARVVPAKSAAVVDTPEKKAAPAGQEAGKTVKEVSERRDRQPAAQGQPKPRQDAGLVPASDKSRQAVRTDEPAQKPPRDTGLRTARTAPVATPRKAGHDSRLRQPPTAAHRAGSVPPAQNPVSSSGVKPLPKKPQGNRNAEQTVAQQKTSPPTPLPVTAVTEKVATAPKIEIRKRVAERAIGPPERAVVKPAATPPAPEPKPAPPAVKPVVPKPVQPKPVHAEAREPEPPRNIRPADPQPPRPLPPPDKVPVRRQVELPNKPPEKTVGSPDVATGKSRTTSSTAKVRAFPPLAGTAPPLSEKPRGIVIPPLSGDLKLVITGQGLYRAEAFFREFRKNRRDVPMTRKEAENRQSVPLKSARTAENVLEMVIETTDEGIYDLVVRSADSRPVTATIALKIRKPGSKPRTKNLGAKKIRGTTLVARVLMPEGILWEDDAYFSGDMEDSDSITKFQTDTGLVWREFKDENP